MSRYIRPLSKTLTSVTLLYCAAVAILSAEVTPKPGDSEQWRWTGVPRVVAFADVHGAYDGLVELLAETDIIDDQLQWIGGDTHLVSVGDLVDRGTDSRKVLDLLMRLQEEASANGGSVHVTLGNHEMMNMIGDLRYVADGEYAAFADEEPAGVREENWQRFFQLHGAEYADLDEATAAFAAMFPPGYFGHREAFSPTGKYGRWLLQRPLLVVINDAAFVHGGLPLLVAELGAAQLNRELLDDLRHYVELRSRLAEAGVLSPFGDDEPFDVVEQWLKSTEPATSVRTPDEQPVAPPPAGNLELHRTAERFLALRESPVFGTAGPLWYRGSALCHPIPETDTAKAALQRLNAEYVVVGHTTTDDRQVRSRLDGRVIMLDTGMLVSAYDGQPSALIIQDEQIHAYYADGTLTAPVPEQRWVGDRPNNMSAEQVAEFLRTATVVSIEDVGTGVTRPKRVTLRQGDIELRAIFRTEDTDVRKGRSSDRERLINISDSYRYEVAAYRLDRLLDLDLVPVTVLREIDGVPGSLQLWVENGINELQRRQQGVEMSSWCPIGPQFQLMFAFDALIYNTDRTLENIFYSKDNWQLRLIDHTRTFRTHRGLPEDLRNEEVILSPELAERLASLDQAQLQEVLYDVLDKVQIKRLITRRDEMLKKWPRTPLPNQNTEG